MTAPTPDGDRSAQRYYQTNYPDYERQTTPEKLRFYLDLVRRWVRPGSSLFELGCGLGHFLATASPHFRVSASEINSYGVSETRRRAPAVEVHLGSYEMIPAEAPPDVVVSWDVLEHLPDLDEGLSTIFQRLSPGGFLIGVVPVYDGPLGWLVTLLDRDPTHVSKFGRHEWLRRLNRAGFDVVERGGILRKLVASQYIHLTRPKTLLRHVGSAYYFAARKPGGGRAT
jgi:SAM-dependent methyltransferase